MSVKLRLARLGTKNAPVYRIVAIDSRRPRDGKFIEDLGTYNPISDEVIRFVPERVSYWISQGAIVSDAVKKIQKKHQLKNPAAA